MDAFPGCFCKSVVGKMISTGGGPNHPICVIPRYQSTGRRQSFCFRPIRNNRRSPGWAAAIYRYDLLNLRCAPTTPSPNSVRRCEYRLFSRLLQWSDRNRAGRDKRPRGGSQIYSSTIRIERIRSPGRMSSITSTPSITRPKQVCTPSKCCVFSRFMQIKNCEPPVSLPR